MRLWCVCVRETRPLALRLMQHACACAERQDLPIQVPPGSSAGQGEEGGRVGGLFKGQKALRGKKFSQPGPTRRIPEPKNVLGFINFGVIRL